MHHPDLQDMMEEIDTLLSERMGARGKDTDARFASVRGDLPRKVRADLTLLIDTARRMAHPKLARQINPRQVAEARTRVRTYLEGLKPGKLRARKRYALLATVAGQVLVVLVLTLVVLRWRGLV